MDQDDVVTYDQKVVGVNRAAFLEQLFKQAEVCFYQQLIKDTYKYFQHICSKS